MKKYFIIDSVCVCVCMYSTGVTLPVTKLVLLIRAVIGFRRKSNTKVRNYSIGIGHKHIKSLKQLDNRMVPRTGWSGCEWKHRIHLHANLSLMLDLAAIPREKAKNKWENKNKFRASSSVYYYFHCMKLLQVKCIMKYRGKIDNTKLDFERCHANNEKRFGEREREIGT